MGRYAAITLSWASFFLVVMAILVNSAPLFYMCTAILATLGAARLQAWLAVRALRVERFAPPAASVGDLVTIDLIVWSERRIKRPLVIVRDGLPSAIRPRELSPTLPIAPSFDQPIRTYYSFRPMRRGIYRWSKLEVHGTDALGLVTLSRNYETDPIELVVYPAPLPVSVEIVALTGWGASDTESANRKGPGLEVRGLREYSQGDPMRYVHWASSARHGKLMVKEFDTSSSSIMLFVLQRTIGSDLGAEGVSSFEAMCGHALYLATKYARQGAGVIFPVHEPLEERWASVERRLHAVQTVLTSIQADSPTTISQDLRGLGRVPAGSSLVLFLCLRDPDLPNAIRELGDVQTVCLVYDADEYRDPRARHNSESSASDPLYLALLEDAGARVVFMPKVHRIGS